MKCTNCGKNEAVAEIYVRRGNEVQKMFLCADCEKKYKANSEMTGFDMIGKLFDALPFGFFPHLNSAEEAPPRVLVCPDCKTTSDEFIKSGFVGCPNCYKVFEQLVVQNVKKFQRSDKHIGKTPVGARAAEGEQDKLKAELLSELDGADEDDIKRLIERIKSGKWED